METKIMKHITDFFTVGFLNLGALVFANVDEVEAVLKVAVLFVTLVYTAIKIYQLIKNIRSRK